MTIPASPAVQYTCKDGTVLPLRELTLHPSDDSARLSMRIMEEFLDATLGFQRSAGSAKTPEDRKKSVLLAAEMRHERDKSFRDFLENLSTDKPLIEKVLAQCGDTDMEMILMAVREGSMDSQKALYEKLARQFAPSPTDDSKPKPIS